MGKKIDTYEKYKSLESDFKKIQNEQILNKEKIKLEKLNQMKNNDVVSQCASRSSTDSTVSSGASFISKFWNE